MTTSVLVPSSLTREAEDKREATRKLGYVARAAAVFRVNRLTIIPDPDGEGKLDGGFMETVFRYAATPPYLRKEVWDKRPELEYVGVLPALRVTPRTGSGSDDSGSLRQGLVTEVGSDGRVRVNCGMQHPISLGVPPNVEVAEGERVAVRIYSRRPVRAKIVDEPLPGFDVDRADLDTALSRPDAGVCIAASRHGVELTVERLGTLVERIDGRHDGDDGDVTLVFGSPARGLPKIFGIDPESVGGDAGDEAVTGSESDTRFDLWLNTIPDQGSEVVQTEEAVLATLACLNLTE